MTQLRFVIDWYHYDSCVTDMLTQLTWESLKQCHFKFRLSVFFKVQHSPIVVHFPGSTLRSKKNRTLQLVPDLFYTVTLRHTKIPLEPYAIGILYQHPSPVRAISFLLRQFCHFSLPSFIIAILS